MNIAFRLMSSAGRQTGQRGVTRNAKKAFLNSMCSFLHHTRRAGMRMSASGNLMPNLRGWKQGRSDQHPNRQKQHPREPPRSTREPTEQLVLRRVHARPYINRSNKKSESEQCVPLAEGGRLAARFALYPEAQTARALHKRIGCETLSVFSGGSEILGALAVREDREKQEFVRVAYPCLRVRWRRYGRIVRLHKSHTKRYRIFAAQRDNWSTHTLFFSFGTPSIVRARRDSRANFRLASGP